ncbi:glycoside hydrolase family 38 C-terminal domain-containing protein [Kiritimatiellaeota bacterium B1221]|nr:glycoside hydrolase family 38 C-terminal domain-containing protein [Kiritimatiellaeota bacterium B1221]
MLRPNQLPQLILPRVDSAVNRLSNLIWESTSPLTVEATSAQPDQCSLQEAKTRKRSILKNESFWGKLFDQRWCKIVFEHPTGENDWLHWEDQGEATLYVNDEPYWGFNAAHNRCQLPEGLKEIWIQSTCVQSAIWHPDATGMSTAGARYKRASLCHRNDEAWQAYHDLKCLFDLALDQRTRETPEIPESICPSGFQPTVNSYSPTFRKLLRWMDEAVDIWETKGLSAMRKHLAKAYAEFKVNAAFAKGVLTGHAHVDLVWIWPERIGEIKAVNVFATANRLMERYPEFRFAYSQPASYEAVQKREPGLYDKIRKHIKSGAWQATGAMYVESDTLIACGEALSRSFALGQEAFEKINGTPSPLTWLPDVFGYAACVPQIMKQHGVEYFFTTKMTWNAINRFPHSSFVWRGNDGSEVLAHVMQDANYVTHMNIKDVLNPMHGNMQADIHEEFLLPTGYGDGGGGTTETMLERARRLDGLPGMPSLEWGQPEEFFHRLNEKRDRYPLHQGECYLEYHRGTFTTHGELKARFRALEKALQVREAVAAATGVSIDVEHPWKRLVFAQFHDYIPGSSVWDVYQEGLPELKALAEEQETLAAETLSTEKNSETSLFNPHAVPLKTWFRDPGGIDKYLQLPPAQGIPVAEAEIPSPEAVKIKGRRISNDRSSFRINSKGWIDSLQWDGVEVPLSAPLAQLILYPDQAANFEPWDIDRHVLSLGKICNSKPEIETWQEGEYRKGFKISRKIGNASHASLILFLEAGCPSVQMKIDLDWQEPNCLLKLHFPTRYSASHARFGAPFGSVLRPQIQNSQIAEAMWEVPFSRYLSVFDDGEREGLYVVTENKYGANVREGNIGISLVRSPRVTGMESHSVAWPPHLSRLDNTPENSDLGHHNIRLAIGRYALDLPREEQPAMMADTLYTPPVSYQGKKTDALFESIQGGETMIPAWIQPGKKKSWVLRFHEVGGQRGIMVLRPKAGWKLSRINLNHTEQTEKISQNKIKFQPYEVISIAFTPID